MIGKTILHYNIIEKLGEGGMGVVYLAEDTKLERKVAIKFLPHHISANSDERKRFEIEAKAAAALNHPNIATIHAIEESEDQTFIVMEYIGDEEPAPMLKDQAPEDPEAFLGKTVEAVRQLYAAGVVHADLSAFNILNYNEKPVLIDLSQATLTRAPMAETYLKRDLQTLCTYFKKIGVDVSPDDLLARIRKPLKP